jgi:hypothetical protein
MITWRSRRNLFFAGSTSNRSRRMSTDFVRDEITRASFLKHRFAKDIGVLAFEYQTTEKHREWLMRLLRPQLISEA